MYVCCPRAVCMSIRPTYLMLFTTNQYIVYKLVALPAALTQCWWEKYARNCSSYLLSTQQSIMNERSFVDFEDVAVLGQSNHRSFPEVDQWVRDIALAFSHPDWSVCVLAQEAHGCVSEGWDLHCFEELPLGHRWVLLSNFLLKCKYNSSIFYLRLLLVNTLHGRDVAAYLL